MKAEDGRGRPVSLAVAVTHDRCLVQLRTAPSSTFRQGVRVIDMTPTTARELAYHLLADAVLADEAYEKRRAAGGLGR